MWLLHWQVDSLPLSHPGSPGKELRVSKSMQLATAIASEIHHVFELVNAPDSLTGFFLID